MKTNLIRIAFCTVGFGIGLGLTGLAPTARAADPNGEFTKPVIDIGIVVKDADRTATQPFGRAGAGAPE